METTPKKKGPPSQYTEAISVEICERISEGEPLRQICRDDHMPAWNTVYKWLNLNADFRKRFAHARDIGFDAIAEDTLDLIDEEPARTDTQFGDKVDPGHVQWQKNRVEQRMKLLAKWSPKKYGEHQMVELTGKDGGPVDMTDSARATRVSQILAAAQRRKNEDDCSDLA